MSLMQFLPFITDDQGRSLAVNNDTVVTRPIPDPIDESPQGWEDNTIQYSRNKEFRAAIVAYITNLVFYFEGARILREYYYKKGTEAVCFFIWLKLDQSFGGGMVHRDWYRGEPDFSTFKDGYTGVQVNISQGGFFKEMQANKTVPYEYKFKDDPDTVSLLADGTVIAQETGWLITNGNEIDPSNGQHTLELEITSNESINSVDTASQRRRRFTDNADLLANSQYFHKTGAIAETINIEMKYSVLPTLATGISPNPSAGSRLLIRAFDDSGIATDAYILDSWGNTGSAFGFYNVYHIGDINTTITVPANRRLYLLQFLTLGGVIATGSTADEVVFWNYQISIEYFFRMKYNYLFKESIIDCFRAYSLGNKFCRSMSKGRSGLQSNLLESDYNLLCTSGDAIRGIEDALCKGNFNGWYKSIDAVKCIGLKVVKNQCEVESRYDYFKSTRIAELGEAKIPDTEFVSPANEYKYSQVNSGFPDTDTNSINGKFSFCTPVSYKTPIESVDNVYECMSIYKADPFVIELIRINTYGKKTTDNSSDNDMFFIDAERVYSDFVGSVQILQLADGLSKITLIGITGLELVTGIRFKILFGYNIRSFRVHFAIETGGNTEIYVTTNVNDETVNTTVEFMHYRLRRKPYVTITGVPSQETLFNTELSPKRCLTPHLPWIRSGIEHMDNKYLTYQTNPKNDKVVTTDAAGVVIKEREDIRVATMGAPVFKPHFFKFQIKSPDNLKELMDADDAGYFSFEADGTTYNGFPEDIKSNDATLESQDYLLLATIDNDFTNRIKS